MHRPKLLFGPFQKLARAVSSRGALKMRPPMGGSSRHVFPSSSLTMRGMKPS